ncbi:MAG: Betaine aldehyde dehydrogenase [Conexibacter sp.]|nr:Betaine aldehyde dehydrogenase [Conexibacter sp.]
MSNVIASSSTNVRRYANHVDGAPLDASGSEPIARHDPASGRLVAQYADAGPDVVDAAVLAARRAFDDGPWPLLSGAERARLLRRFATVVDGERERLAALDSQEVGKPLRLARGDLEGVVAQIEFAASLAHTDHGSSWTQLDTGFVAYATHEPLGVAALIVPWNFPALILSQKLPYALAAGCTVVVKPSELTSSSALEIADLALAAGIPPGVVNVVTGYGPTTGQALIEHPGVDVVSFTGSTATGREVAAAAGRGLKRVGLELGGKAANVVFADADLDAAADAAVFAAFFNQGECCVSGSRLLIDVRIAEDFVATVVARAATLVTGAPDDEATDVGALIHERHLDKVLDHVAGATEAGAHLLIGGARLTGGGLADGAFMAPTIFGGVDAGSRLFREEVFGPVLAVATFDGADDAIRLTNATDYGLSNAVWTSDVGTALAVSEGMRSGTVWINTNIDGSPALAFGGMKASGIGREVGFEGLREFSSSKTVQLRRGDRALPFPRAATEEGR